MGESHDWGPWYQAEDGMWISECRDGGCMWRQSSSTHPADLAKGKDPFAAVVGIDRATVLDRGFR